MPSERVIIKQFRIPVALGEKLESESRESGKSMNAIIVELLERRYGDATRDSDTETDTR